MPSVIKKSRKPLDVRFVRHYLGIVAIGAAGDQTMFKNMGIPQMAFIGFTVQFLVLIAALTFAA